MRDYFYKRMDRIGDASRQLVSSQRGRSALSLAAFFLCAFAVPLLIVWGSRASRPAAAEYQKILEEHSIRIDPQSQRLIVLGSENLNPAPDKDLIIFSTWKLRSIPEPGERTVLVSKAAIARQPGAASGGDGFALGLINDQGSLRFMLSWPSAEGPRWMRFGEVFIKPDEWFLIALSIRKQQSVGAFFAPLKSNLTKPNVTVLGGFDVAGFGGGSNEPLSLAPMGSGKLVSRLGPFGMFRGSDLGGSEIEILKELAVAPIAYPASLKRNQIVLFSTGGDRAVGIRDEDSFALSRTSDSLRWSATREPKS